MSAAELTDPAAVLQKWLEKLYPQVQTPDALRQTQEALQPVPARDTIDKLVVELLSQARENALDPALATTVALMAAHRAAYVERMLADFKRRRA